MKALGIAWAAWLDIKYPEGGWATALDLVDKKAEGDEKCTEVDMSAIKTLKRTSSDAPPPVLEHKFKRGDEATVTKRMSWSFPRADDPEYRKDINVGTKGTIEGFQDAEGRQVLFKCIVTLSDGDQTITHAVSPQNLTKTSEYELGKAQEGAEATGSGEAPSSEKGQKDPHDSRVGHWRDRSNDGQD